MKPIMKISLLFIALLLISADNDYYSKIREEANLQKNEYLVVIFYNPATCIKCYLEPYNIIEYLEQNKKNKKIKYLALVRCDRKRELSIFKRDTNWKWHISPDYGKAKKKLSASENTFMMIFDYDFEQLLKLKSGDKRNSEKIVKFIKNYT